LLHQPLRCSRSAHKVSPFFASFVLSPCARRSRRKIQMSRCPRFNDLMSSRSKVTTLLCWPHSSATVQGAEAGITESSECSVPNYSVSSETSCSSLPLVSLSHPQPDIITLKLSENESDSSRLAESGGVDTG
jgi:hypothetical protein